MSRGFLAGAMTYYLNGFYAEGCYYILACFYLELINDQKAEVCVHIKKIYFSKNK